MVLPARNLGWEKLKEEILRQKSFVDKYGDECKEISLGKVADLTPSGRQRDFGRPARNLNASGSYKGYVKAPKSLTGPIDKSEQEDSDWWRDLIEQGKKHKIYIRPSSDKNRTFIMAGIKIKDRSET
jgi:hypothetical protein